jgi:alpha-L-rhamnosidase
MKLSLKREQFAHRIAIATFALGILLSSFAFPLDASADTNTDTLIAGFREPPNSARPRVWWHWMNGNITEDGIRKDMEWMKRVGIGGLQNFDASLLTPQVVEKRLVYMTPDWKHAFHFAAELADQLDLELAIASSPGWSETGGPWVQPKNGLKKVVWSETLVKGGKRFSGKLPQPPAATGPFQALVADDPMSALTPDQKVRPPSYYEDTIVLAFPAGNARESVLPKVTAGNGESIDAAILNDGDLETTIELKRGTAEQPATLVLIYPVATTVRSATLYVAGQNMLSSLGVLPRLDARAGGGVWHKVSDVPLSAVPTTVSFDAITAKEFRLVFEPKDTATIRMPESAPGAAGAEIFAAMSAAAQKPMKIAELHLSTDAKVNRFEAKAGFSVERDYYELDSDVGGNIDGIAPGGVVELTGRMQPDGTLNWAPPRGNWRVLRMGFSLLGTTNHPAPPEATGLEVDKFDGDAVREYLETYLGMYRNAAGDALIGAHGVRALVTDSIEVGAANWTPKMLAQFKRLRGYDATPWMPALTGVIIGSRKASDAFLYDYRRTLADLIASEHYGTVATVAHQRGLKVYGEALEDNRPSLGDDMTMRSHTDVPMSAMWTYGRKSGPKPTYLADIKGAASVAHLYGQNLVAAESMTSSRAPWAFAPSDLRRVIDLEFVTGVNRPVIHTSVHQPVDDKVPGLSLFFFGQYFNRHENWAEMAKPWVDYISRNSYLLQQGRNFADVAYFYGEEGPLTGLYGEMPIADAPTRYAYDFLSVDALMHLLSVENGELIAKSGARYKLLYLGGSSSRMTLAVLKQIASLAESGAVIVGDAPQSSPGLNDDKAAFDALVKRLWSGQPVTTVGQGKVIAGQNVESALASQQLNPDFNYTKPQNDSEILFVHRRLVDGDVYFVNNRKDRSEHVDAHFRVIGKTPEIWRADSGSVEPVSYRTEGAETVVPLDLDAEDSFFVVFRKPAQTPSAKVPPVVFTRVANIDGPWDIAFQANRGAPASIRLDSLASLSEQTDPGVKYFSGVATYTKTFTLPAATKSGAPLFIDLGRIGDVAEVRVNGHMVGTVWKAPYRLNIGPWVHGGHNALDIRVANLWVNRLIGDAQPGAKKITYTTMPTYTPAAPLRPAGLLGPVTLLKVETQGRLQ